MLHSELVTEKTNMSEMHQKNISERGSLAQDKQGSLFCRGQVEIEIVSATNLPRGDSKSSDPFCVLNCGEKSLKTSTKKKTCEPVWNENLVFFFDTWEECKNATIDVLVYDWDMIGSNDLLSTCVIDCLGDCPVGSPIRDMISATDYKPITPNADHRSFALENKSTENFVPDNFSSGSFFHYTCETSGVTQTFKTNTLKKTLDPVWENQLFTFVFSNWSELLNAKVFVQIFDWDLIGSNDILGEIVGGISNFGVVNGSPIKDDTIGSLMKPVKGIREERSFELSNASTGKDKDLSSGGEIFVAVTVEGFPTEENKLKMEIEEARLQIRKEKQEEAATKRNQNPDDVCNSEISSFESKGDGTGIVEVGVVSARNLCRGDAISSDPYVELILLDETGNPIAGDHAQKFKTATKKTTLNPDFNENFVFYFDCWSSCKSAQIQIKIWDWDLIGSNDLLASTIIRNLLCKTSTGEEFIKPRIVNYTVDDSGNWISGDPLNEKSTPLKIYTERSIELDNSLTKGKDSNKSSGGEINLRLAIHGFDKTIIKKRNSSLDVSGFSSLSEMSTAKAAAQRLKGKDVSGQVVVEVIRAENLPRADRKSSDPFVKLTCGTQVFKTVTKKKQLNPIYSEKFIFNYSSWYVCTKTDIKIEVIDYDMIGRNDLMGTCSLGSLNVNTLLYNNPSLSEHRTLVLANHTKGKDKNKPGGVLYLKVSLKGFQNGTSWIIHADKQKQALANAKKYKNYTLSPEELKQAKNAALLRDDNGDIPGEVTIEILRAINLTRGDGRSSDPYVSILCGGERFKSSTKKKNLNPDWTNDPPKTKEFKIRFSSWNSCKIAEIQIDIYDWDLLGGDDILGSATIGSLFVKSLLLHETCTEERVLLLSNKITKGPDKNREDGGEIHIRVSVGGFAKMWLVDFAEEDDNTIKGDKVDNSTVDTIRLGDHVLFVINTKDIDTDEKYIPGIIKSISDAKMFDIEYKNSKNKKETVVDVARSNIRLQPRMGQLDFDACALYKALIESFPFACSKREDVSTSIDTLKMTKQFFFEGILNGANFTIKAEKYAQSNVGISNMCLVAGTISKDVLFTGELTVTQFSNILRHLYGETLSWPTGKDIYEMIKDKYYGMKWIDPMTGNINYINIGNIHRVFYPIQTDDSRRFALRYPSIDGMGNISHTRNENLVMVQISKTSAPKNYNTPKTSNQGIRGVSIYVLNILTFEKRTIFIPNVTCASVVGQVKILLMSEDREIERKRTTRVAELKKHEEKRKRLLSAKRKKYEKAAMRVRMGMKTNEEKLASVVALSTEVAMDAASEAGISAHVAYGYYTEAVISHQKIRKRKRKLAKQARVRKKSKYYIDKYGRRRLRDNEREKQGYKEARQMLNLLEEKWFARGASNFDLELIAQMRALKRRINNGNVDDQTVGRITMNDIRLERFLMNLPDLVMSPDINSTSCNSKNRKRHFEQEQIHKLTGSSFAGITKSRRSKSKLKLTQKRKLKCQKVPNVSKETKETKEMDNLEKRSNNSKNEKCLPRVKQKKLKGPKSRKPPLVIGPFSRAKFNYNNINTKKESMALYQLQDLAKRRIRSKRNRIIGGRSSTNTGSKVLPNDSIRFGYLSRMPISLRSSDYGSMFEIAAHRLGFRGERLRYLYSDLAGEDLFEPGKLKTLLEEMYASSQQQKHKSRKKRGVVRRKSKSKRVKKVILQNSISMTQNSKQDENIIVKLAKPDEVKT